MYHRTDRVRDGTTIEHNNNDHIINDVATCVKVCMCLVDRYVLAAVWNQN